MFAYNNCVLLAVACEKFCISLQYYLVYIIPIKLHFSYRTGGES